MALRLGMTDPFKGLMAQQTPSYVTSAEQEAEKARTGIAEREPERQKAEEKFLTERKEMTQKLAAKKTTIGQDYADSYSNLLQDPQFKEAEIAQFTPSKTSGQDLIALFAGLSALTFLSGGNGRYSGNAGMNNLANAMEGWNKGRQDLFKTEMQEFDKNIKATQEHNKGIQKRLEQAISMLSTNRDAALGELKVLEAELGDSELAYNLRAGRFDRADKIARDAITAADKVVAKWQDTLRNRETKQADIDARLFIADQAHKDRIAAIEARTNKGKSLTPKQKSEVDGLDSLGDGLAKLTKDFKPEYAKLGVMGFGADVQLEAARRGVTPAGDQAMISWWSRYGRFQTPNRHALFGATLTGNELKDYRSYTAKPGDSAETIMTMLRDQTDYVRGESVRKRDDFELRGYSVPGESQVDFEQSYGGQPAQAPQAQPQAPAAPRGSMQNPIKIQ